MKEWTFWLILAIKNKVFLLFINFLFLFASMAEKNPPATPAINIPSHLTVSQFSKKLGESLSDVIKKLMANGVLASINDTIDFETAFLIAQEFGKEIVLEETENSNEITLEKLQAIMQEENENKKDFAPRPPVITILGHVDHGKTTLLDTLRETHIVEKEAGGITQHINAYQIKNKERLITFIDTPGHEAFQSMRQRGALAADIVILVVAADDGIKPQTKEVAKFVLERKIPFLVAINKIDKPEANVNKVKQQLSEIGIFVEGYGGEISVCEISAKKNLGLDDLLDTVLLLADIYDFRADAERDALGIILESHKDPQRGPVSTALIKTGTLKVGQNIVAGRVFGKIKKLENYAGKTVKEAGPSMPVVIMGLNQLPQSNDILRTEQDKLEIKKQKKTAQGQKTFSASIGQMGSEQIIKTLDKAKKTKWPIVLKADFQGSMEALLQILLAIPSNEVSAEIVKKGIGPITESDVKAAQSAGADVFGFNSLPTSLASRMAKEMKVDIQSFSVIYELVEKAKEAMAELLEPEIKKIDLGRLKVLAIFKTGKNQMIVGGKVLQGEMVKGETLEILRKEDFIGKGKLIQLQHNKENAPKVKEGLECGITFDGIGIEVGDFLDCYREEKIKRKL